MSMRTQNPAAFRRALAGWYRANRRAMPWRGIRDPYRIWLSEVMLQQTRVAAVVGYYTRFVRRFPTVQSLAHAPQSEVLRYWAGLGYYSRARNLHRAAKEIVARHNGRFPRSLDEALALPGVGRYTAAAVLSIAYRQPHAVLDGNVARVLARLHALRGDLRQPRRWRKLQSLADELMRKDDATARKLLPSRAAQPRLGVRRLAAALPREARFAQSPRQPRPNANDASLRNPGDWNQAMMELGAAVCKPRSPRCNACPVARCCRARKLGIVSRIPASRRKPAPVRISIAAAVLLDPRGRTLLVPPERGATNGLFSHMWQFPAVVGAGIARAGGRIKSLTQRTPRTAEDAEKAARFIALKPAKHSVTFREITLRPYLLRVPALPHIAGARKPRLDSLAEAVDRPAVSSATRKIAQRALDHLRNQKGARA